MEPTITLVIALAFTLGGGVLGWVLGRPRAPQPTVLAAQDQLFAVMRAHMAQLTAEVGQARTEAAAARAETEALRHEYAALAAQGVSERADLQRQIYAVRADLAAAQAQALAWARAVAADAPDVAARIRERLPPEAPPAPTATGPLPWRAVFPLRAQTALLAVLLGRLDVFGAAEGRTLLLSDCPDDWVGTLRRVPVPREDLVAILEGAARYNLETLAQVLRNATECVGAGSQAGQALAAWRDAWKL